MKNIKTIAVLIVLLCGLVLVKLPTVSARAPAYRESARSWRLSPANVSSAASSTQYTIESVVLGAGGASMSSSTYGLAGTVAQPATGISTSSTYVLCAGYWCGMDAEHPIYLPLVLREA